MKSSQDPKIGARDPKTRAEISALIERRRRELSERPDISQTMRKLSQSGSRNPIVPPRKKPSSVRPLVLGLVAMLVLLTCTAGAIIVTAGGLSLRNQLDSPSTTVEQFYSALHLKNYAQAYKYMSSSAQARISQSSFADQYASLDKIDGIIQTYPIRSVQTEGSSATVVVAVGRRGNTDTAQLQTLRLVQQSNGWRIDIIAATGTIPIPTATS